MKLGDNLSVSGCFTKEKFIAGRTLGEIEKILGFHTGRLASGISVAAILELPNLDQFELGAYSNVASHRFKLPQDLNISKIKAEARGTWTTAGFERIVKVLPDTRHNSNMDPDIQYPPGQGAPQWVAKVPLRAKIVAIVADYPNGRYRAVDLARP